MTPVPSDPAVPFPQPHSKTEKFIQDSGNHSFLSSPLRVKSSTPACSPKMPFPEQRKIPLDDKASTQKFKDNVAKFTSDAPKPYGTIPPPKQRRRISTPPVSKPPSTLLSNTVHEDTTELAEEDVFGAFPSSPPYTPPPPKSDKLLKRQSMPASLKAAVSTANISQSVYSSLLPPNKATPTPTPSRSSPTSLLCLSRSSPSTPQTSPLNRFSLYKFSISPPSTTYATLRSLNPFSTSPPTPPTSPVEKSDLSLPAISSPKLVGSFFTFLDDVAPVVAAAGGELVGISEMPKWAGMGGTTSATVSTLSALLRNNDRLRAEMQLRSPNPLLLRRSRSEPSPSPVKNARVPISLTAAAAAGAPPAPLVVLGGQHLHLREPRLNPAYLRMMAAEMNMMRAGKLVGPLRPRGWLPRRRDPWDGKKLGRWSDLRQEISVEC